MASFTNLYNTMLLKLQDYFIKKDDERSEFIGQILLKRTIFLAFYLTILNQKSYSKKIVRDFLNNPDYLLITNKFLHFKEITEILFPIDLTGIKNITKEKRNSINGLLKNFIKNFTWEPTLKTDCSSKEDIITSEIFELIYNYEKTKKLGVVFTPYPFAYWMVQSVFQNHLAKFLNLKHFSIDKIENLDELRVESLKKYISKIRVLDIAIGCGTFYLASLNYLLMLNNHLDIMGDNKLLLKKNILAKNLFAIDIDKNALDVCKIRISIQILKENPLITAEDLVKILKSTNLKQGNSLIGFISNHKFKDTYEKTALDKILFKNIKDDRVKSSPFIDNQKVFHWFVEFPEVFRELGSFGFNILVGNPPYIGYRFIDKNIKRVLKSLYPTIYTGLNDYYYYFILRAKQLLAPNGNCVLIVARYFLEARYARKLRTQLFKSKQGKVEIIVDLREFKIFPKGINTVILFITNGIRVNQKSRMIILRNYGLSFESLLHDLQLCLDNPTQKICQNFHQFLFNESNFITSKLILVSNPLKDLLRRIENQCVPLSEVCDIGTGYHTGNDKIYSHNIIEEGGKYYGLVKNCEKNVKYLIESDIVKEIVKTKDILPFKTLWENRYVILTKRGINIHNYPLTKQYLEQSRDILENRYEVRNGLAKWYEIAQVRNYRIFKAKRKIICPYRAQVPRFAIDEKRRYTSIDCTSIILKEECLLSIYYIIGLLNSELIEFYLYALAKKLDARKIELYPKTIANIPLKIPKNEEDKTLVKEITKLAKDICKILESLEFSAEQHQLLLNKGKKGLFELNQENQIVRDLAKKLDRLVYRLYGVENQVSILKREVIHPFLKKVKSC